MKLFLGKVPIAIEEVKVIITATTATTAATAATTATWSALRTK